MALKSLCLLWNLALLVPCVASLCNVTCSTDYDSLLNCSCSASVQSNPVLLQVSCSGEDEEVNGSCEVTPPQTWCVVHQESLFEVASVGNMCSATASPRVDGVLLASTDSSTWALSDVVKPQPPYKVQVARADGFYNITWAHDNTGDCLVYRLRIRESRGLSKDPVYTLDMKMEFIHLRHDKLRPRVGYTADLQAKMCPDNVLRGPWSEWSAAAEWTTGGQRSQPGASSTEMIGRQWLVSLAVLPVLGLLCLCFVKKQFVLEKLQVWAFVPKPDVFFKPLYREHGGDFKEWVKPVFSEYDYLRVNSPVQVTSEKRHDVLQRSDKESSRDEEAETRHFLPPPGPRGSFRDGSGFQGTGHSAARVSIHTVILSGEGFEQEAAAAAPPSSTANPGCPPGGGSVASLAEDHVEQDPEAPPAAEPDFRAPEPERISLDSFDGYPQVDLDTVDSGFAECGSPAASESGHVAVFGEHRDSNCHYVKQWMARNLVQEDAGHSDGELSETL